MKKIVIFGATGDVGQYFVKYCLSSINNDYEIIATGSRDTDVFKKYGIKYYKIDIRNKEELSILPHEDIYAIVDFAGMMPARMEGYYPQKYIDINITGTLNILEYAKNVKVDRILYTQSFGDIKDYGNEKILLSVDMNRNFSFTSDHTVYVLSKNFAVDLIENYHQVYGIKNFIFRLPTIYLYSPVDTFYVDGKIKKIGYRQLIDKAIRGETIEVWGNPNREKDMIYVKDLCQMMYKACFVDLETGHYNAGTGVGTSLIEQIEGIVKVFSDNNNPSKIVMKPDMPDAPQYIMDIKEAVSDLGYKPEYNYISMLEDIKKEMNNYENDICTNHNTNTK